MSTKEAPPDVPDPMRRFIASRVIVAANLLRRGAARRYARLGLSSVEFGIVAMLGGCEPLPLRTLAALLGMDKAQLSRALSVLTRRGLIRRVAGVADGREALVSLTDTGEAANAAILDSAERVNERLLEGWSAEDTRTFAALVARMTDRARVLLAEEEGPGRAQPPGGTPPSPHT